MFDVNSYFSSALRVFRTVALAGSAMLLSVNGFASNLIPAVEPLVFGYADIPFVSPANLHKYKLSQARGPNSIVSFCQKVANEFRRYGWTESPCGTVNWRAELKSPGGDPLIYASFGDGPDTTLFLSGVHPDELTPLHLGFRFARYLQSHPEVYASRGIRVVVAPLVNPDGFFLSKPLRTNGLVDVNRNFFTLDWYDKAVSAWRNRRKGRPRYFPGYFPNTEIETLFQMRLIDDYRPDKILSMHAPLGFLDFDGPGDQKPQHLSRTERRAKQFVYAVSKKSQNYRIVDYSFYPGSLGNYAGNERNLPTITLELETTRPKQVNTYWDQFLPGFLLSVHYPFRHGQEDHQEKAVPPKFYGSYDKDAIKERL